MGKKRIKVMVAGAFDLLHLGHINFFRQAKKHGNYLVVVVATDKMVKKVKGKAPYFNQNERLEIIKSLKMVDRAVIGNPNNVLLSVLREKPVVVGLGYDQNKTIKQLKAELAALNFHPKKIFVAKPFNARKYKSTKLKEYLLQQL